MNTAQVAVVTGATGGIGYAICQTLSRDGYAIIAHYHRNRDKAHDLARSLQRNGNSCHLVSADLATDNGIDRVVTFIDEVLAQHPTYSLRALVNNAAKLLGPTFFEATRTQFDQYLSINTKAPFFLAQQIIKRMVVGGSIVNISSASAHFSSPGDIVYAMSKAGIESLTKNMAEAIAPHGLRVNTVIPGFTDNGHEAFRSAEVRQYMSSFSVLGDISTPETVADAVAFLLSDKANRSTGATLDVSGGSILSARGSRVTSIAALLHHDE